MTAAGVSAETRTSSNLPRLFVSAVEILAFQHHSNAIARRSKRWLGEQTSAMASQQ